MASRREFLNRTLWTALTLWAAPSALWGAAGVVHVVRRGDTLSDLARDYGTTISAIKRANGLRSGVIRVGQKLTIPGATVAAAAGTTTYVVRKGDTLGDIAEAHATDVATLRRLNRLDSDLIRVGQELTVPSAAAARDRNYPLNTALLAPVVAATRRIRVDPRRWTYIVCHHSAIEDGNARIYGNAHLRRGMEHGLAYHFVIGNGRDSGDGEIEVGPRWHKQLRGGHVRSTVVNDTGIGICLVGNLENHAPTHRQRDALNSLLGYLRDGLTDPRAELTVHKWVDRNHTLCPGRHFVYDDLKRWS